MPIPHLTLEERVGQVVVAVWPGDAESLAGAVALGRVGGLLLPPGASRGEGALAADLERLQRQATYPLLCLADAEGGLGPLVPGALTLAAARRPDLAYRAGALAGAEARARGAHLVLAPPLDVAREPGRGAVRPSFGDNPSLVARLGAAFVEGCRAMGTMAVGRYFPGRGGATHGGGRLPTLTQDRASLAKIDLLPYVEACRVGLSAIMTGHLHVAALDNLPTRLATHSSAVAQGLLRGTLGFQGLLLTDNLDAGEVSAHYGPAEAAVLAFAAGHDLVVTGHPEEAYRALYEVLLNGDIPQARLQEAVGRVWAARAWLGLAGAPGPAAAWSAELERGPELAREAAQASLVAVRGRPGLVAGPRPLLVAHHLARPDGTLLEEDVRRLAAARAPESDLHLLDERPAPEQLEQVMAAASAADSALLLADLPGTGAGRLLEAMAALAAALKRAGLPVGVVLMGSPYALPRFREADLLLYLPGDSAVALEAALACVGGELEAVGRLPVRVPGLE